MALVNSDYNQDNQYVFAGSQTAAPNLGPPGTMVQMGNFAIATVKPKWSWCQFGTAVFTFLCCNCTLGLVGLIYAVLAYVDHKTGDHLNIHRKKSCSWGFTITGIVLGAIGWVVLILLATMYGVVIYEALHPKP